jgi:hypothetical protein
LFSIPQCFLVNLLMPAADIFPGILLVIMRAISLLTGWPDTSQTSRRMSATWEADGKLIPSAPVIQQDHCLIFPRERSRITPWGFSMVSGASFANTLACREGRFPLTFMR